MARNISRDERRAAIDAGSVTVAAIVTCSNTACRNSEIAANELTNLGYTNVREYAEGKQDRQEAGLELVGRAEVTA